MNREAKIVLIDAAKFSGSLLGALLLIVLFGVLVNIGILVGNLATKDLDFSLRSFTELMSLNGLGIEGGLRHFLSIVNWCVLALIPIYLILGPIREYLLDVSARARQGAK